MNIKLIRNFGLWIAGTFLVFLIITTIILYINGSIEDIKDFLPYIAKEIWVNPIGWVFLMAPYLIFRLSKYLFFSWKKHSPLIFLKRFSFTVILPVAFFFSALGFSNWYTQPEEYNYTWDDSFNNTKDTIQNRYAIDKKHRGMHVFDRREMNDEVLNELLSTNIEWVTLVPFGWQENYDTETIGRKDTDYTKWNRRDTMYIEKVERLKSKGFHIMIKPHIWMSTSSGKWRSDISQKTEAGWQRWSESYRQFILHYARMCEIVNADLFCIGTELHTTVNEHPEFWSQLITDARKIYSGKITYAANWNKEMTDVTFWDQLDYIGIQAYFPLTQKNQPSVRNLKRGWKKHIKEIEGLYKKYNKPVLFSELGYKSTEDSGIEPWLWPDNLKGLYKKVCFKTQANCYEAFFQTFWDKEWFAGVHFWQWQTSHGRKKSKKEERKNISFTPQNKPAENIMTKWFARLGK